jgi:hypothetical protein
MFEELCNFGNWCLFQCTTSSRRSRRAEFLNVHHFFLLDVLGCHRAVVTSSSGVSMDFSSLIVKFLLRIIIQSIHSITIRILVQLNFPRPIVSRLIIIITRHYALRFIHLFLHILHGSLPQPLTIHWVKDCNELLCLQRSSDGSIELLTLIKRIIHLLHGSLKHRTSVVVALRRIFLFASVLFRCSKFEYRVILFNLWALIR